MKLLQPATYAPGRPSGGFGATMLLRRRGRGGRGRKLAFLDQPQEFGGGGLALLGRERGVVPGNLDPLRHAEQVPEGQFADGDLVRLQVRNERGERRRVSALVFAQR